MLIIRTSARMLFARFFMELIPFQSYVVWNMCGIVSCPCGAHNSRIPQKQGKNTLSGLKTPEEHMPLS
jgi:hypothetical protein